MSKHQIKLNNFRPAGASVIMDEGDALKAKARVLQSEWHKREQSLLQASKSAENRARAGSIQLCREQLENNFGLHRL